MFSFILCCFYDMAMTFVLEFVKIIDCSKYLYIIIYLTDIHNFGTLFIVLFYPIFLSNRFNSPFIPYLALKDIKFFILNKELLQIFYKYIKFSIKNEKIKKINKNKNFLIYG